MRVLMVEPNGHHRFARAHALRAHHSVATTSNVDGAMRLLTQERFDAMVVTEGFEGEGLALLELVARSHPTTRRYLLTRWEEKAQLAALAAGRVDALLITPFDLAMLLAAIHETAAAKSSGRTTRQGRR